ncbi:MAG: tetratricopeptide repeat protein, partial [Deltaproteobacteria bacterium]
MLSSCTHVRPVTDSGATDHDTPVAEASPSAKRSLERGKKLAAQRRFLEAIDAFEEAIASDPGSTEAHEALATTLATVGRSEEALRVLRAAEARFPNEPRFVFLEGRIHLQAGRLDEAETAFEETLRIEPDHPFALLNLGMIKMYRDNETEAALQAFERVTTRMPEDPQGYRFLGEAHLRLGHLDAAVTALQEALRHDPRNVDAHILLGAAYFRQEKLDAAIIEFREAIRLDPDNTDARFRLGFALHQEGKFDEALQTYDEVLARAPDFLLVHLLEANIYVQQGAYEKVLESLVTVMVRDFERTFTGATAGSEKRGGAMTPAANPLQNIPDAEKLRSETQAELSRRLETDADSPAAHILLALVAVDRGEPEVARFECRRALELDAHNPYAHFVMGLLYLNGNEPDKALASFMASTQEDPSFTPGHLLEGWVEEYRGNLDAAIAAYGKVANPKRPSITLHLANLLLRRGAYEEAGEHFRSLLAHDPHHPAAQRGEALAAFGQARDGRAYWLVRKVFTANPGDAQLCYMLGVLEIERGEKAQGVSTLARCLSIESKEAIDFDFIFRDVRNRKEVYAALVEAG